MTACNKMLLLECQVGKTLITLIETGVTISGNECEQEQTLGSRGLGYLLGSEPLLAPVSNKVPKAWPSDDLRNAMLDIYQTIVRHGLV
jgi:hypothetical protein